jgi:hypothetical protein
LWVDPPEDEPSPSAAAYEQVVADSAVYGGSWVVSLDRGLRVDLSSGRAEARDTRDRIARSLSFFEVLELAEAQGLGARDLGAIEVAGTPVREARFDFAPFIRSRLRHRPLAEYADGAQES